MTLFFRLILLQIRARMAYPVAFMFDMITVGINGLFYPLAIFLTFSRFGDLAGWTLGELAFLWGMSDFCFGLARTFFDGFEHNKFSQQVRQGTLDQLLLRPINITVQMLADGFDLRRLGHIARGILIFVFALSQVHIAWTTAKLLYMPLFISGLVGFFGGIFIAGATFTFWTVDSGEIVEIFTFGVKNMMVYPMHIYVGWMRVTFTYFIPAALLSYYPALYLLDKPDPFHLPQATAFLAPLVGVSILMVALMFWRFGIQHYQSTGS